jgi:hypothetical protein
MNIWSFAGLFGLDIAQVAVLRFLWIPVLAVAAVYWFRKKSLGVAELSLAVVSFYFLFMISYSWVSEQTFLDTLPVIFLLIVAYRPKRSYRYGLIAVQILIYAFSFFNGGSAIFQPLFEKFSPAVVGPAQQLSSNSSWLIWNIRGYLGLIISVALICYLAALVEPDLLKRSKEKISKAFPKHSIVKKQAT